MNTLTWHGVQVATAKLADIAVWRPDTLPHIDIVDPVAALALGAPSPLELALVGGTRVVEKNRLTTIDTDSHATPVRERRPNAAAPRGEGLQLEIGRNHQNAPAI